MPRLAPDGVRCKESRLTTGNMERKLMATYISELKKDRMQKYVNSFALPITGLFLAVGLGVGGYFVATSIVEADPVKKVKDAGKEVWAWTTGETYDPSTEEYAPKTVKSTSPEQGPFENDEGEIPNPIGGIPIVGGLFAWGMKLGAKTSEPVTTGSWWWNR
jgi:hypothetical protein